MKKLLTATLTAALAISMIGTSTASAEIITDDSNASVKFIGGNLTVDGPTDDLVFDEKIITDDKMETKLLNPLNLTVSDFRGTGGGWTLSAELTEFNNNENPTLQGSYINLNNGTATTDNSKDYVGTLEVKGIELISGAGSSSNVLTAEGNSDNFSSAQGKGTWNLAWEADNVELIVPNAMASVGTHTATINWTFEDTPSTGDGI